MTESLIETQRIGRRYGRRIALRGVDLSVHGGQIVALAGPNGSGKTTLLKLLAGLLRPTFGRVRVFGVDPYRRRTQVMREARFAFAPPALYESLTAMEHVRFLSAAGVRRRHHPPPQRIEEVLRTVGLSGRATDRIRTYSFGMRQRLALALCLIPMPRVLILDEPTDGLDPLAILELRQVLDRLRREHGLAILLSSHLLIELEKLADHIVVLAEGRPLFAGAPRQLVKQAGRLVLRIEGDTQQAVAALRSRGLEPTVENGSVLSLPEGSLPLREAARLLERDGVVLLDFHEQRPTLEQVVLDRLRRAR